MRITNRTHVCVYCGWRILEIKQVMTIGDIGKATKPLLKIFIWNCVKSVQARLYVCMEDG
jgi:hypothetical protein